MLFLQLLINGIQVGALYALTAAGFALIFGATKVFHVAHGATFTIAAYVFHYFYSVAGAHWLLAVIAASVTAIGFGILLDRYIYAQIKKYEGSLFTVFVASFGATVVVQNVIGMTFGRGFISVTTPLSRSVEVVTDLFLSPLAAVAIVTALVLFYALQSFLSRTHIGMALRALSENEDLVRVYGMSPRQLSTIAFALGSFLVVPAAILTTATAGVNPAIGHHIMLLSLAATIVGGVGNLYGAACAGLLLGLAESLALWFFEPQWSQAITFIVMFLFILFRPAGFFGRATVT